MPNTIKTIIIVEDEMLVQQNLSEYLEKNNFEVYTFDDAESFFKSELLSVADAVIMDIGLKGMDGWHATMKIKEQRSALPVLMLTAYSDINYRIQGFETGADDYIIKPFFQEELLARLKAVLRTYEKIPSKRSSYKLDDLVIDTDTKTVNRNELPVKLSQIEYKLLEFLAEENGKPVSKDQIRQRVWKGNYNIGDNTIEVYINILRSKIDKNATTKLIHTKHGFGYYLSTTQV